MQWIDVVEQSMIGMQKILSAAPVLGIIVLLTVASVAIVGIISMGRDEP